MASLRAPCARKYCNCSALFVTLADRAVAPNYLSSRQPAPCSAHSCWSGAPARRCTGSFAPSVPYMCFPAISTRSRALTEQAVAVVVARLMSVLLARLCFAQRPRAALPFSPKRVSIQLVWRRRGTFDFYFAIPRDAPIFRAATVSSKQLHRNAPSTIVRPETTDPAAVCRTPRREVAGSLHKKQLLWARTLLEVFTYA